MSSNRKSIALILALSIFAAPISASVAHADDAVVAAAKAAVEKLQSEIAQKEAEITKLIAAFDAATKDHDQWTVPMEVAFGGTMASWITIIGGRGVVTKTQRVVLVIGMVAFLVSVTADVDIGYHLSISNGQMEAIKAQIEKAKSEIRDRKIALDALSAALTAAGQ